MFSQLKDFDISNPLSLDEKSFFNSLFLGIRYKHSLSFLKKGKKPNKSSFKAFVKTMILGYGSTHSAKGSGFFIDPYFRLTTENITPLYTTGININRKSQLCHTIIKKKNENQISI